MQFMLNNKEIIIDLINSEVLNAAKKVHLVASLHLYKEKKRTKDKLALK